MGKMIFKPTFITGMKFLLHSFLPIVSKIFKFRFVAPEIATWLRSVLRNNLAQRKKTPLPQEDLLQCLTDGMDQGRMDEDEVISHAFAFFIEGFETSSNVLAYALYAMAKDKGVQEKLRHNIREVLERHHQAFSFDALQDMQYLEALIQGKRSHFLKYFLITIVSPIKRPCGCILLL